MDQHFLQGKLDERRKNGSLRTLKNREGAIDFCSNDYLGIATRNLLQEEITSNQYTSGSTGSRLLSGNYLQLEQTERKIAAFHNSETALIFNSGFDANLGLLSCIASRGDTIFYDELSHASIRDGLRLSFARSASFKHNDVADLDRQLKKSSGRCFVVTESLFSMDGDLAPLDQMAALCNQYQCYLIVDEAHATGIIGDKGSGLVQHLHLEEMCFARIHTFGKAVGCHGAAVLGSKILKEYLVNYARSFIYSTALPPSATRAIELSYDIFPGLDEERAQLQRLIHHFRQLPIHYQRLDSMTPIQGILAPGNSSAQNLAEKLQKNHFDIRPIFYPTVPKGSERLRIILHSFNTIDQVDLLGEFLQ